MLNIVNQFNIKKNKGYQNLSFKFQKKFSNHLFTVLQLMVEECKNSEVLSLYIKILYLPLFILLLIK